MSNDILINQNVAILCDGNNIERSIHEASGNTTTMVNFDSLIPRLLNKRGLNRLIYFREGKAISSKLADRLHENYYGSVVPCHKSADIPLSIKATQLASKVDTIIIMSGDSDFLDLVIHLKSEGVRVEIAAVRKTTSRYLIDAADYYHPITDKDWFNYKPPRSKSRHKPVNKPTHRTKPINKLESKPVTVNKPAPKPKSINKPILKNKPASKPVKKKTS